MTCLTWPDLRTNLFLAKDAMGFYTCLVVINDTSFAGRNVRRSQARSEWKTGVDQTYQLFFTWWRMDISGQDSYCVLNDLISKFKGEKKNLSCLSGDWTLFVLIGRESACQPVRWRTSKMRHYPWNTHHSCSWKRRGQSIILLDMV